MVLTDKEIVFVWVFLRLFLWYRNQGESKKKKTYSNKSINFTEQQLSSNIATRYVDYPIFSLCKIPDPVSESDLIVLSGGGGGAMYGVPNRIEMYRVTQYSVDLIYSKVILKIAYYLTFCPQKHLILGAFGNNCIFWSVDPSNTKLKVVSEWEISNNDAFTMDCCTANFDASFVAVVSTKGTLFVFELEWLSSTQVSHIQCRATIPELHTKTVTDMKFTPDGNFIVTVSRDGYCKIIGPCLSPDPQLFPENQVLHSFTLTLPKEIRRNSREKSITDSTLIIPRNVICFSITSTDHKVVHRNQYQVLTSAYLRDRSSSFLFITDVCTNFSRNSTEPDNTAVVTSQQACYIEQPNCIMFNCISMTDNKQTIVAVSNQRFYVYQLSSNIKLLAHFPRCADSYSDLPATGCSFINSDKQLTIIAGDYGITVVDLIHLTGAVPRRLVSRGFHWLEHKINLFIAISCCFMISLWLTIILFEFKDGLFDHSVESDRTSLSQKLVLPENLHDEL